ncbi:MAG: PLDc N-terminal domain-containing protein [Acidimicrobiia bacterium]|nr:PLDc N-terminal domain-containing protein [Acidimicrobiia bacterium]
MINPFALAELLLAALLLSVPVLLMVALVDLARHPRIAWDATGQNQAAWFFVVTLIGFIGPMLYLLMARPRLLAAPPRANHPSMIDTVELDVVRAPLVSH